jgi:hypothetical protein
MENALPQPRPARKSQVVNLRKGHYALVWKRPARNRKPADLAPVLHLKPGARPGG